MPIAGSELHGSDTPAKVSFQMMRVSIQIADAFIRTELARKSK
jgi:hypothetical protein